MMQKNIGFVEGEPTSLGRTITARVEVNGVSADALVDTGSPATIGLYHGGPGEERCDQQGMLLHGAEYSYT